ILMKHLFAHTPEFSGASGEEKGVISWQLMSILNSCLKLVSTLVTKQAVGTRKWRHTFTASVKTRTLLTLPKRLKASKKPSIFLRKPPLQVSQFSLWQPKSKLKMLFVQLPKALTSHT